MTALTDAAHSGDRRAILTAALDYACACLEDPTTPAYTRPPLLAQVRALSADLDAINADHQPSRRHPGPGSNRATDRDHSKVESLTPLDALRRRRTARLAEG